MDNINLTQFATFGDFAQFWLATKVDTKPTTQACYRSLLQCAAARFADMPITQIERADIMRWIVDLIEQREYDAGQVRAAHRVVHSTLALARCLGAIESNPATEITLPRIRNHSPRLDRRLAVPELESLAQQIGWWKLVPVHEVSLGLSGAFSRGESTRDRLGGGGGVPFHEAPSGGGGAAHDGESSRDMGVAPREPRAIPKITQRNPQFLQVKGKSGYLMRREERYGNRQLPASKRRHRGGNCRCLKGVSPENPSATRIATPPGTLPGTLPGAVPATPPEVNQLEVLILMLGYCGLRIGEALALTWSDIEWSRRIIQVRHAFTEVSGRLVLGTPKNGKTRTVPIPQFLVEGGLRRLFDFDRAVFAPFHEAPSQNLGHIQGYAPFGSPEASGGGGAPFHEVPSGAAGAAHDGESSRDMGVAPHEPRAVEAFCGGETPRYTPGELRQVHVFRTRQNKPLRASNLRFHFALAAAAIGETGLHIHDLRHTAASLAVSAGANVKALAQMLGHSSAAMTLDVYADLFAEDLSDVADALDGLRRRQLR